MKMLFTSKDGCPIFEPLDNDAHVWLYSECDEYHEMVNHLTVLPGPYYLQVEVPQGAVGEYLVDFFAEGGELVGPGPKEAKNEPKR